VKLAALDPWAWWIEGEPARERAHPLKNAAAVFAVMAAASIDVLYVHASALESLGLPGELEPPLPGEQRPRHAWLDCQLRGERPSHSALSPSIKLGERELLIGAYQDGAGDPFADARDGRELLAAAVAYADALAERGRRWAYRNSAALTGWNLMHAPWEGGGRRRRRPLDGPSNPQPELEGHAEGAQVEIPYGGKWAASGGASYPQLPYVAAWDVNAQRLAACSRLALGVGGLEYVDWDAAGAPEQNELKLPGYHYVESVEQRHAGAIPPIFEPGWHTTPRVAMARYLHLDPVVRCSWVWTEHLPYLDPFYERMRVARERLLSHHPDPGVRHERAIALGALKQTYLQPFGRLRSARLRDARDVRYRPSWYDTIIGQELARQYLRLHELAEAGVAVLAVYFDTIICEVPSPDWTPEQLTVSSQLGKYKRAGGVLSTAEAHAALYVGDGAYEVGTLMKALNAAAGARSTPRRPYSGAPAAALGAFIRPTHGGYPEPACGAPIGPAAYCLGCGVV
jgi:hypothetical protein